MFETAIEDEAPLLQDITSDLTLTPDHTWLVSGLTTVATAATLTAEPGTTVKFEEAARLDVWGRVSSVGTLEDPIRWLNKTPPATSYFAPLQEYPVGQGPTDLIVVDVTGDSLKDIVVVNLGATSQYGGYSGGNNISVLVAIAGGGFLPQETYAVGDEPMSVIAEDVTCDGNTDLLTANAGSHDLSVLIGDGFGRFLPESRLVNGQEIGPYRVFQSPAWHLTNENASIILPLTEGLIVSDITGDGIPDLVTMDLDQDEVIVSKGSGAGDFPTTLRYRVGDYPVSVLASDVTADGVVDLITANYLSDDVSVLVGDGAGLFRPQVRFPVGKWPRDVIPADVTGDGNEDLITVNNNDISVLSGNGAGDFTEDPYLLGTSPEAAVAADVTGDGVKDLIVSDHSSNCVILLIADGVGSFLPQVRLPAGDYPKQFLLSDVTGDRLPDIIIAQTGYWGFGERISVLRGTRQKCFPPPHPFGHYATDVDLADITGDGISDVITTGGLYAGDGVGGFILEATFPSGETVIAADVTGDHLADIVTANYWNEVLVFARNADRGLSLPDRYTTAIRPREIAVGDVTLDGVTDVVAVGESSEISLGYDIEIFAGDGAGGFRRSSLLPWSVYPCEHVVLGDVNHDDNPDIIVAGGGGIAVYLGDGFGGFLLPSAGSEILPRLTSDYSNAVALGDLDGDTFVDLVILNVAPTNNITILNGNSSGQFSLIACYSIKSQPGYLALVELTGDDFLDIAITDTIHNDVSVFPGNGTGQLLPPIRYNVGSDPRRVSVGDVTGDGIRDLVVAHASTDGVIVLAGDGSGGYGAKASIRCYSNGQAFDHSEFELPGPTSLLAGGNVERCRFRGSGGSGLAYCGSGSVYDNTATSCSACGFSFSGIPTALSKLFASHNGSAGILTTSTILDSCAISNGGNGIMCFGGILNCIADLNGGIGLVAGYSVLSSRSNWNTNHGISARVVKDSVAAGNSYTGIVASERVEDCTAIGNTTGIESPVIIDSLIIDSFGSALVGGGDVDSSRILGNRLISTFSTTFNDTIIANNGERPFVGEIENMYIAGNEGGGMDGIPVYFSTIIGNKGPGVVNNDRVVGSNVVFNEGPGVVGGVVNSSYVTGNRGGDLIDAIENSPSAQPRQEAPPFLMGVVPNEGYILGSGPVEFELTFSAPMKTSKNPLVSFGQAYPYTQFFVSSEAVWSDTRTWRGSFTVTNDVPDGTHTIRVAQAVSQTGFPIPPDTYHRFRVNKDGPSITLTPTPTMMAASTPTQTPFTTPTLTSFKTPTPTNTHNYDVAPTVPDGNIDCMDLLWMMGSIRSGSEEEWILLDFARFWMTGDSP